jgi:predicted RNA-binding protein with PIN domain
MQRRYVIDGYNLLHQFPELRKRMEGDLEGAREGMLARLAGFSQRKSVSMTVVFDGAPGSIKAPSRWRSIDTVFSSPPQKADPVIKKIVASRKKGEEMVVVTSDREIGMYARLCGIRVESAETFARGLEVGPENGLERKFDHPLSEEEVEEWMRLFNGNRGKRNPGSGT